MVLSRCRTGILISVGPMSELTDVPAGAVDLKGATVTPGFIDAHCHIGIEEDSDWADGF